MKKISQIAKECNVPQDVVFRFIKKLELVTQKNKYRLTLTRYQEDYLHQVLYYSGFITEVTFESKINT